jgi:hypothetical protein
MQTLFAIANLNIREATMRKAALFVLLVLASTAAANAGVVRATAKTVKFTAKTATQPARHPVKDTKAVGHAVGTAIW